LKEDKLMKEADDKYVSMRQALRFLLARRQGFDEYHPVWSCNKLAQFYVIDVVLRILENTNNTIRRLYSEFRRLERFVS